MTLIAYNTARHEDLRDVVSKVVQEQKMTFLDLVLDQGMAADDIKHYWVDKTLKGYKDTLQASISSSTTTITIADGAYKRIIDGVTYAQIGTEKLKVTAGAGTNTLTVVRGQLGSSAAAQTAGDEVIFYTQLHEEGADNTRDDSQSGSKIYNVTQIFRRELKLSGTSQAVKSVAADNLWSNQVSELLPELLQELRTAALFGIRYADGDESLRTMGGLQHFATNQDNAGGAAIDTDMFDDAILELLDNGANPNKLVMLMPGAQIKRLNALKVARVTGGGMAQSETKIVNTVDQYEFTDAIVKVMRIPELKRNEFYIGEIDKLKVVPLQGRSFRVEDIGKVGDSVQKLLVGEYTLEAMNAPKVWVRKYNLAV